MKLRVKTTFNSWYIIIIYAKFSKEIILNRDLCGVFLELQAKKTFNYWSMEQNKLNLVFRSTMVDVESRWSAEHFKMAFCSILQQIFVDVESHWSAERWCSEHWSSSGWSVDMHSKKPQYIHSLQNTGTPSIHLFLGHYEEIPSYRRSLLPFIYGTINFLACLDPDPYPDSQSGLKSRDGSNPDPKQWLMLWLFLSTGSWISLFILSR